MGNDSFVTPMAQPFYLFLLQADGGINADTCGLDDVFPRDDLGSGP